MEYRREGIPAGPGGQVECEENRGKKAFPYGQGIGTFESQSLNQLGWSGSFPVEASPCLGQLGQLHFIQQELWAGLSPFLFLTL